MLIIEEKDDSKTQKKEHTAKEVAKIIVENMMANMNNPNFWNEREERLQKAAEAVIKKRRERHRNEE